MGRCGMCEALGSSLVLQMTNKRNGDQTSSTDKNREVTLGCQEKWGRGGFEVQSTSPLSSSLSLPLPFISIS